MKYRALSGSLLLLLSLWSVQAFAQINPVPQFMNFQGRLAKPDGTPVANGNYNIGLSLYSALSGGTLLWSQSLVNVPASNGVFTTRLNFSSGYQNGTTYASLFAASAAYLEITLNGGAPLTPRQQLVTVAYAMKADTALTVPDGSITDAKIVGVNWSKISNKPTTLLALPYTGSVNSTNPTFALTNTGSGYALSVLASQVALYSESSTSLAVYGRSFGSGNFGVGVLGICDAGTGVYARSKSGTGLYSESQSGDGIQSYTDSGHGVYAFAGGLGIGVYGHSQFSIGIYGHSATGTAIYGVSDSYDGISGRTNTTNRSGIYGYSSVLGGYGVYGGNVSSSGYALFANGKSGGTQNWNAASDRRYKTNIATFANALDAIAALRGVTFDWKRSAFPTLHFAEGRQIGFIAQEVERVLPELVSTDAKGYKSVAYANVVPVLVEAVKAQQQQMGAREKRLSVLEAENAALKAHLAAILHRLEKVENALRR